MTSYPHIRYIHTKCKWARLELETSVLKGFKSYSLPSPCSHAFCIRVNNILWYISWCVCSLVVRARGYNEPTGNGMQKRMRFKFYDLTRGVFDRVWNDFWACAMGFGGIIRRFWFLLFRAFHHSMERNFRVSELNRLIPSYYSALGSTFKK